MKSTILRLAKLYKVKVEFKKDGQEWIGLYFVKTNTIQINTSYSQRHYLKAFFHELGHHHCVKNKIWTTYHRISSKFKTLNEYNRFRRVALKAERWVDNWGKKECAKHFPNYFYPETYKNYYAVKLLTTYHKSLKPNVSSRKFSSSRQST